MNYTIKPYTGSDTQRIIDWSVRQAVVCESKEDGTIEFGFGKNSLQASSVYSALKRLANFTVL